MGIDEEDQEAVLKLLLDKNANVESSDKDGRTPLSWAAEKSHVAIVKLLLDKNANVKSEDKDGRTPLSWAAENYFNRGVLELLSQQKDNDGSID